MRKVVLVVVCAVFLAACDWAQYLAGPERTGFSSDTSISAGQVAAKDLTPRWSAPAGGAPVVAGGLVFAGFLGGIGAFDAAGVTNCSGSPLVCAPRFTAYSPGTGLGDPAVEGSVLVATGSNGTNGIVAAFDARGITNCSGTPVICLPLWTASTFAATTAVTIAGGIVYQASNFSGLSAEVNVSAYDLAGVQNCAGAPVVCSPLWSATVAGSVTVPPSVSNGVAYLAATTGLFAFDPVHTPNCVLSPLDCTPLWVGGIPGGPVPNAHPAVASGLVFIAGASPKNLYGFDASGLRGCSPTFGVCQPIWMAAQAGPYPAIANGNLYVETPNQLAVYDATGTNNCQGTTVKTCTPLRTYPSLVDCYWTGGQCNDSSPPVIANGVLYQGFFSKGPNGLNAYDATGTLNCTGTPKTCTPIGSWSGGSPTAPAISNKFVYNPTFNGTLVALGLP